MNIRKILDSVMNHGAECGDSLRDNVEKKSYWLLSLIFLGVVVVLGVLYAFAHGFIFKKKK